MSAIKSNVYGLSCIIALMSGCAEQPPYEPPLNKAGDQAKRTGTLLVTGERDLVHEVIPLHFTYTPPVEFDLRVFETIFNPPMLSATEVATIPIPVNRVSGTEAR